MSVIEVPVVAPAVVTVRDILHRAADLIEEFGHCKRQYARNADGVGVEVWENPRSFCAVGAVMRAAMDFGGDSNTGLTMAYDQLGMKGVTLWNDQPERTPAEVVAVLREAAERAA